MNSLLSAMETALWKYNGFSQIIGYLIEADSVIENDALYALSAAMDANQKELKELYDGFCLLSKTMKKQEAVI